MNKLSYCVLIIILLIASAEVRSQTASKVEVGAQFTSLTLPTNEYANFTEPGFGGRVTYNVNDNLALEGEVNFFLNSHVFGYLAEGRGIQAQFGVKAGKRYKRFGVFAKARPGFLTLGDVFSYQPGTHLSIYGIPALNTRLGRETHFTTDLGGVVEFYPSRKTVVRFDAGDTILRFGPHLDRDPVNYLQLVKVPSRITHNFQITAGVGFRFGSPTAQTPIQTSNDKGTDLPRFEVGVHFTSMSMNPPNRICPDICFGGTDGGPMTEPGLGGRFTYNIHRNLGLDAEVNFFTRDLGLGFTGPAGHVYQGQFGVKAGKRFETFGLFGKFRPGFVGFSQTTQLTGTHTLLFGGTPFVVGDFRIGRKEYFSMDAGGVIELYVSRRIMTRMDFGDTIIKYGEFVGEGFSLSRNILRRPPETRHNFQFTAGVGFRF
jgi:outer membrane protein with beta-barrel domain